MSTRGLPEPKIFLTGHEPSSGKSILLPSRDLQWESFDSGQMPMAVAYVNKLPADLNNDADLEYNKRVNNKDIGLVSGGAAVLRYVDLAPGYTCMMHRTKSIDYGIILAGEAECVMDNGEVQLMKQNDVMVQRYTKHAWRNPSKTSWSRIVFVLMDCKTLVVDGKTLKEDLGGGAAYVPPSNNEV